MMGWEVGLVVRLVVVWVSALKGVVKVEDPQRDKIKAEGVR